MGKETTRRGVIRGRHQQERQLWEEKLNGRVTMMERQLEVEKKAK